MRFLKRKIVLLVVGVFLVSGPDEKGSKSSKFTPEGIRCVMAVAQQTILPYESIGVLIRLRNETAGLKRVVAAWRVSLGIGEITAEGVRWYGYDPDAEPIPGPPEPTAIELGPGESRTWIAHLDYHHPGRHVFEHPGRYKIKGALGYQIKGRENGYFESEAIEIRVREPQGADAQAYEFLRRTELHKFLSERTVHKYPYDHHVMESLEAFVMAFERSRYSELAQLGLALMWMHGVEGRRDLTKAQGLLTELSQRTRGAMAARVYYYLGEVAKQQGELIQAEQYYERALSLKIDPYFQYLVEKAQAKLELRRSPSKR